LNNGCSSQRCWCRQRELALARAPSCRCGEYLLAPALPPGGLDLDRWLQGLALTMLDQALLQSGGNKARAARLLGLNRTTLVERLKRFAHPGSST